MCTRCWYNMCTRCWYNMAAAARLWCSICTPAEWAGPPIIKHIIAASPSFSSLTKSEPKYANTNKNDWMPHQTGQHSQAEKALNVEICLARDIILPQERSISDLGYKHAAIATALRFFGSKNKKTIVKNNVIFSWLWRFPQQPANKVVPSVMTKMASTQCNGRPNVWLANITPTQTGWGKTILSQNETVFFNNFLLARHYLLFFALDNFPDGKRIWMKL